MKETAHCFKCDKDKPKSEFTKDRTRGVQVSSRCKACSRKKDETRREYMREYMRKNMKEHPEKWEARALARKHVPKKPCGVCGHEKVQAHHEDYSKPLDVNWLCKKHHVEAHYPKTTPNNN